MSRNLEFPKIFLFEFEPDEEIVWCTDDESGDGEVCEYVPAAALAERDARIAELEAALDEIAGEQKIYKGHGDYDIEAMQDALEAARPYVDLVAEGFREVPDGLSPMFYHTLSAEGDRKEGARLQGVLDQMDAATKGTTNKGEE